MEVSEVAQKTDLSTEWTEVKGKKSNTVLTETPTEQAESGAVLTAA